MADLGSIYDIKEHQQTHLMLLLAEFVFTGGQTLRAASQPLNVAEGGVQYESEDYLGRLIDVDLNAVQALAASGIDYAPSATVHIADSDQYVKTNFRQLYGFRGATLTLKLIGYDVINKLFTSDFRIIFVGTCAEAPVDQMTLTVTATSLNSMAQSGVPGLQLQGTCFHNFPVTLEDRIAGATDPSSIFFGCGYSRADTIAGEAAISGGVGNYDPNGATATTCFTSCSLDRAACLQRMGNPVNNDIAHDTAGNYTARFSGVQWNGSGIGIQSRGYLSGAWTWILQDTGLQARYGTPIPTMYGEGWINPLVISTNGGDSNFGRNTLLVSFGEIESIIKVVANGNVIPHTYDDTVFSDVPAGVQDLSAASKSGWWKGISRGTRNGGVDPSVHVNENPDCYGSLCVIAIQVPTQLAAANSVMTVQIWLKGQRLRLYSSTNPGGWALDTVSGFYYTKQYTDNLAWCMMDIFTWAVWVYDQMNLQTWITYAALCEGQLPYLTPTTAELVIGNYPQIVDVSAVTTDTNPDGSPHKRYTVSLPLERSQNVSTIVTGLRVAGRAITYMDENGKLCVKAEQTLADQQPTKPVGSNSTVHMASIHQDGTAGFGWPAYEFDERSIALKEGSEESTLQITNKALSEIPNVVNVPIQDLNNSFTNGAIQLVEPEDIVRVGFQISGDIPIQGINCMDQAQRAVALWWSKRLRGNARLNNFGQAVGDTGGTDTYEFETSVKGIHLSVNDIITISNQKFGLVKQMARITSLKPIHEFNRMQITADHHNDIWDTDYWGLGNTALWKPSNNSGKRLPYSLSPFVQQPAAGDVWFDLTDWTFLIQQNYSTGASGEAIARATVYLVPPINKFASIGPPFVAENGTAVVATTGGNLPGGHMYYYQVASLTLPPGFSNNGTSYPSTMAKVWVPAGTDTNMITLALSGWNAPILPATMTVPQTAHGFTVGQPLYYTGTVYALASQANPSVVGLVSSVPDANHFVLMTRGTITGLSGLVNLTAYYLDATPGAVVTPAPSSGPVVEVYTAVSTSSAVLDNFWLVSFGWVVYGSQDDPNRFSQQIDSTLLGPTPTTIDITDYVVSANPIPDSQFDHALVKVKRSLMVGCFTVPIVALTTTTFQIALPYGVGMGTNQFQNFDISVLANAPTSSSPNIPLGNWTIPSNTADTFTLTGPDPVAMGLEAGAIICIRMNPTIGTDATGNFISDTALANQFNDVAAPPVGIVNATNASPIRVQTGSPHGLTTGDKVFVSGVLGNTAANTLTNGTVFDSTHVDLDGTTGSGGYTSGGLIQKIQDGLVPSAHKGNFLFCVKGTGHGTANVISDNWKDRIYIQGSWVVPPDATSRFIIVEPAWQDLISQAPANVSDAANVNAIPITGRIGNYSNQTLLFQVFAVDGEGNESLPGDSPFREALFFGGVGAPGTGPTFTMQIQGPLAIGSEMVPPGVLDLSSIRVAAAARIVLGSGGAPLGADLTVVATVDGVAWLTLVVAAGTTVITATAPAIAALTPVPAGSVLSFDITAVGTTSGSPGRDMTFTIFFA